MFEFVAGHLADSADVSAGVLFDGRLGENFKLLSGTWVNVGERRLAVIAACPDLIADVVIAGRDKDHVVALIFPKMSACRALCGPNAASDRAVLDDDLVRRRFAAALRTHNRTAQGSSQRVVRALLLEEPPSIDAGEITDKGCQRAVLMHRQPLVETLYDDTALASVRTVKADDPLVMCKRAIRTSRTERRSAPPH